MIIGHRKILDYLEAASASGQIHHAYCFAGPSQVGKRTVARNLAAKLLQVDESKLPTHPDFYYVERVEEIKTGKLKKDIAVAQAREIRAHLQSRSWSGGYQVVIVDEAELLNEESSNALLKTLEEPPEKTVIILLTENEEKLLPTIKSRCQVLFFPLVPEAEISAGVRSFSADAAQVDKVARASWGRPGRAIEFLQNPDRYLEYEKELSRWKRIISDQPFYLKLKEIESAFGDKDDAIRGREKLQEILDVWISECRRELMAGTRERGVKIIDWLFYAKELLKQNIHPRLLLEQVLLNF